MMGEFGKEGYFYFFMIMETIINRAYHHEESSISLRTLAKDLRVRVPKLKRILNSMVRYKLIKVKAQDEKKDIIEITITSKLVSQ